MYVHEITTLAQICNETERSAQNFSSGEKILISTDIFSVHASDVAPPPQQTSAETWAIGLICVTIICSCSAIGIAVLRLLSKRVYFRVLTYCVGLGVGSLSGAALFYLLPNAFVSAIVDTPQVAAMIRANRTQLAVKSWLAVFGVYLFFITDRFLKFLLEYRKKYKQVPDVELQLAPQPLLVCRKVHDEGGEGPALSMAISRDVSSAALVLNDSRCSETDVRTVDANDDDDVIVEHHHQPSIDFKKGDSVIATVAWMIIFGDGLHKFIDGLSIGAAFSASISSGISVSTAVLCEEFPHELGDVAILLNAGMTFKQALVYNLLSASTCYLGFIVGVLAGELAAASEYIFPLAGGMFLYIALATMIPELADTVEQTLIKATKKAHSMPQPAAGTNARLSSVGGIPRNFQKPLIVLTLQTLGICTGLLVMFLLTHYEEHIRIT